MRISKRNCTGTLHRGNFYLLLCAVQAVPDVSLLSSSQKYCWVWAAPCSTAQQSPSPHHSTSQLSPALVPSQHWSQQRSRPLGTFKYLILFYLLSLHNSEHQRAKTECWPSFTAKQVRELQLRGLAQPTSSKPAEPDQLHPWLCPWRSHSHGELP